MFKSRERRWLYRTAIAVLSLLLNSAAHAKRDAKVVVGQIKQNMVVTADAINTEKNSEATLATHPNDAVAAEELRKAREVQRSNDQYRDQGASEFPNSFAVQNAAADAATAEGDWKAGVRYGQNAVDLAGNDPAQLAGSLKFLALAQNKTGDYDSAAANAKRALDLKPADQKLTYDLMSIYQDSISRSAAAAHDAKANAFAKNLSGNMKPSNLGPGALPPPSTPAPSPYRNPQVELAGQRALARKTGTEFFLKAKASLALGDAAEALKYADAAVKADPSLPDGYFERATSLAVMHQLTRAITDLKTAIELWQGSGQNARLAEAHGLSAKLKNDAGDHKGALDDADKAIGYDASGAPAYWQRGVAREALGQVQLALADYNKSADLAPQEYGAPRDEAAARLMAPANAGPSAHPQAPGLLSAVARNYKGILGVAGLLLILVAAFSMWASRPNSPVKHLTWSTPFRNPSDSSAATSVPGGADGELIPLNGKYLRGRQIGQGGMGAVYEGRDKDLRRRVAIKCLRPELQSRPRERARFIDEALRVASLHHPHIVEIYDIIQAADATSIVFEYVEGRTLHDELNNNPGRHLEPKRALKHLREIAEALDYAHKHGVIHRDVKPANFMIDEHGRTKVMDFGIARLVIDSMAEMSTNTIVGTPSYMPPEQSMGKISRSLDIYALGVTLYEMLTGALPYRGEDLNARLEGRFLPPSKLLPELPAAIDDVMKKALDPNPENRQKTCLQLFEEAAGAFNERPTPA